MRGHVNLCDAGRGWRLRIATVGLGVVIAQLIVMTELSVPPVWWATLALPLFVVSMQVAQAYSGVCVMQARHGTRTVGGVQEPVLDPRKRAALRRRGREVTAIAVAMTAVSTSLVLALALMR
jgi:hypothetical protein